MTIILAAILLTGFSCGETTTATTVAAEQESQLTAADAPDTSLPITPSRGYEGYGAVTHGGKGKRVVHVTNLNATGPGSLHEAMGSNRTIVFDVAGTISGFRWDGSGRYAVSNLTIDGASAPLPGITLDNGNNGYCLTFEQGCHDIIVNHIRIRNAGMDGISVVGAWNMVFDHISVSGSGDGSLDISQGAHHITVQWSIFGPGKSGWAGPMLIAYPPTRDISIHHNLFSSFGEGAGERNPFVHNAIDYKPNVVDYLMCDFTNNVVWNWGKSDGGYGYGSSVDFGGTLQARNNFYQSDNAPEHAIIKDHESKGAKVYASGNISDNRGIDPDKAGNVAKPWKVAPVTMQDACTAARLVLAWAGAQPLDETDQAIVNKVKLKACPEIKIKKPAMSSAAASGSSKGDEKFLLSVDFDDAGDITTDQGVYNSHSMSVFKSGGGSFRSEVRKEQLGESSDRRGEIAYDDLSLNEGVYEYDVYYEDWKAFSDGGHTVQWQSAGGGGAVLSLQNYGGKFTVVRSLNGSNSYGPDAQKPVAPNQWYHLRWEIKWAGDESGYVKLFIDKKLYYSYKGATTGGSGTPNWKVGQSRWPNNGNALRETTVVYYDNVRVFRR